MRGEGWGWRGGEGDGGIGERVGKGGGGRVGENPSQCRASREFMQREEHNAFAYWFLISVMTAISERRGTGDRASRKRRPLLHLRRLRGHYLQKSRHLSFIGFFRMHQDKLRVYWFWSCLNSCLIVLIVFKRLGKTGSLKNIIRTRASWIRDHLASANIAISLFYQSLNRLIACLHICSSTAQVPKPR